eukprot:g7923.t1
MFLAFEANGSYRGKRFVSYRGKRFVSRQTVRIEANGSYRGKRFVSRQTVRIEANGSYRGKRFVSRQTVRIEANGSYRGKGLYGSELVQVNSHGYYRGIHSFPPRTLIMNKSSALLVQREYSELKTRRFRFNPWTGHTLFGQFHTGRTNHILSVCPELDISNSS